MYKKITKKIVHVYLRLNKTFVYIAGVVWGAAVWGIVQRKIAGIAVFMFGTPLGMISS